MLVLLNQLTYSKDIDCKGNSVCLYSFVRTWFGVDFIEPVSDRQDLKITASMLCKLVLSLFTFISCCDRRGLCWMSQLELQPSLH